MDQQTEWAPRSTTTSARGIPGTSATLRAFRQARDGADDNLNSFDPYPAGHTGESHATGGIGRCRRLRSLRRLALAGRAQSAVPDAGRHQRHRPRGAVDCDDRTAFTKPGPNLGGDQWGRVEFSSYFRPPGLPGIVAPGDPRRRGHRRDHVPLDLDLRLSLRHDFQRSGQQLAQQQPAARLRIVPVPQPELRPARFLAPARAAACPSTSTPSTPNPAIPASLPTYD